MEGEGSRAAGPSSTLDDHQLIAGWATKLGAKVKSWRRRYFALYRHERRLRYYSPSVTSLTAARVKPKGHIPLGSSTELLAESQCPVSWPNNHKPGTGIGIKTPLRTYYIVCDTPSDAAEWFEVMRKETSRPKLDASALSVEDLSVSSEDEHSVGGDSLASTGSSPMRSNTTIGRKVEAGLAAPPHPSPPRHASCLATIVPPKHAPARGGAGATAGGALWEEEPVIVVQSDLDGLTREELMLLAAALRKENVELKASVKRLEAANVLTVPDRHTNLAGSQFAARAEEDQGYARASQAAFAIQSWYRQIKLREKFAAAKAQRAAERVKREAEAAAAATTGGRDGGAGMRSNSNRKSTAGLSPGDARAPSCSYRRPSARHSFRSFTTSSRHATFGGDAIHVSESSPLDGEVDTLEEVLEPALQRQQRVAIYLFNQKPKKYLYLLEQAGLIDLARPETISTFIYEQRGLNRGMVGEFLGDNSDATANVLQAYAQAFDFKACTLDQSLRLFLFAFRIPGEAQKIERVVETFARRFHECNTELFQHEDTAFVMAFSILMLHTDLHNASNPRRMTPDEFVRNNRGIDNGDDLPAAYLKRIYERIKSEEFQVCLDHTYIVETIAARITGEPEEPLISPERVYVGELAVTEIFKTGSARPKRQVTLFLFNNVLLVANKHKWDSRKFSLRKELPLFDVALAVFPGLEHTYDVTERDDPSHILFRFQLPPDSDHAMLDDISEYIEQCADVRSVMEQRKKLAAPHVESSA